MWQRTIDCLGLAVAVESPLPELASPLATVLATYADTTGAADLTYRLELAEQPRLIRDGAVASVQDHPLDLVPAFELDLYTHLIAAVRGLVLHAGAVVGGSGATLVFTGRSGAGKSTLIRALLARGFRYLSEECVALFADRRCRGLARSLHVDDPSLVPPPGYAWDPYVLRDRPEILLRLFHPPDHVVWRGDARTVAVVAIDHAPGAADSLDRLTGGAALAAIWPTAFRQDREALELAATALDGVPTFRLITSSAASALDHALALASELGVEPAR